MTKARLAARSRSHLDGRFKALGPATRFAPPVRGWIEAIRGALGMSTAQLAKRLRVKQPSVIALEQSEAKGTLETATLRRGGARTCARGRLGRREHWMLLEGQKGTARARDSKARLDELVRETSPRLFWD